MRFYTIILIVMTMVSCGNSECSDSELEESKNNLEETNEETVFIENDSKYNYENEWEVFKTAILHKDVKGVSNFASSDAVDAEQLIKSMDNEEFIKTLKKTKYEDLGVNETEDDICIEFHAIGNGNTITIFFNEGDEFLELDYFTTSN